MKILHICLASFYIDNYSYQENLLPKYHKKMGLEVEIIASLVSFDENGEQIILQNSPKEYINENGIPVTRLDYKKGLLNIRLRKYIGTYEAIEKSAPDIIFIHGCQFLDIKQVVRYAKENPHIKIYVDNHADFSNSATNWLSKNILHKIIWKKSAQLIEPYTNKFYGVLPARVDFLINVYGIPSNKVDLLLMGADDEKIEEAIKKDVISTTRNFYGIKDTDFLIVSGGKLDTAKLQIFNLMKVVRKLERQNIKLIVYGSVAKELQKEFNEMIQHPSIIYVGWIDNDLSYKLFSASNLVIFPGRHSVYWEQVVAMGKPLVVKHWTGTTHIDIGGNVQYLYDDTEKELSVILSNIIYNKRVYNKLRLNAQKDDKKLFLYSQIAKKSIAN